MGQVRTATDPLGTITQYGYDSFGNQTSIVRDVGSGRLNQLTSLGYSPQGDVISTTDPRGNITTSTYDVARRLTATTLPNGTVTALSYDPDGHLLQTQQSAGGAVLRTVSATYTLTGKIATTTGANNNPPTHYAYDVNDRLASMTDSLGRQTIYAYDAMSRQISVSNPAIQSAPLLQHAYTPDGLLASLTDANHHSTIFTYDGFDRLATTIYPLGSTKTRTYDADGNVVARKNRANQTINYAYDTLNRLITKTPPSPAPVVSYGYDLAGRRTSLSDTSAAIAAAVPPSGISVQYGTSTAYDALNRSISVTWNPAPTAAAPTASSVTFGHSYNKANQRIGQSVSDNSWLNYPAATPSTVSYTANALNQYTAVGAVTPSYDGNGNLASDGTFTYGYDARSRLTSASGAGNIATYAYDAQGRRKTKAVNGVTTVFVTDAANREVLEYDGSSGAILRWYAYGLGSNDVLNQTNIAAVTRTALVPDIQASIVASLDSATATLTKAGYSPYGESANAPASFGYTGGRIDPETNGLYYYRARHYSPTLGRFLQVDPIGYSGGINLYAYVNNDPLNLLDPFGLSPDSPQSNYGYGYGANAMRAADNLSAGNYGAAAYYELLHTSETLLAITPFGAAENAVARGASALAAESAPSFSAIGSTGQVGEQWLANNLGGTSQAYFSTSQGARYVDQFANGIANESKVGYTSLTSSVQTQISKDVELMQTQQVGGVNWHFFDSPVTGLGGPSQPLLNSLQQNGINVILH